MDKKRRLMLLLSLALGIGGAASVYANDTDIYFYSNPGGAGEPLVMFILDYRPNVLGEVVCNDRNDSKCEPIKEYLPEGKKILFFDALRGILKRVLSSPSLTGVKVGLMLNHADNCSPSASGPNVTGCSNGAYILYGFNEDKIGFHEKLADIPVAEKGTGQTAHDFQGKELYFELFRYLTGQGIYNGHLGYQNFGNTNSSTNLDEYLPLASWDKTIESGPNYISPLVEDCSKVFAINLLFGTSNQEDASDAAIRASTSSGGMGLSLKPPNNNFEAVIEKMRQMDLADGSFGSTPNLLDKQNVTSWFIAKPLVKRIHDYAYVGGTGSGLELSDDPQKLLDIIENIFNQILSISTTFVSASVPVDAFNRADILNHTYIALFQVDRDGKPHWPGNLKKLKFNEERTHLVDALGQNAVAIDGRINFNALTFWTDPDKLPAPNLDENEVAGRDGRSVERGGAGQRIPGFISGSPGMLNSDNGARKLFTEPESGTTLLPLNADTHTAQILQADLGASTADEALCLIKYARGFDVTPSCDNTVTNPPKRSWLLGDVLHSRPYPINYGAREGYSQTNPDVRIVMGGNDGYMRMFRDTTPAGVEVGEEAWAFMPRSVMPTQKRLSANTPGTPVHPYGVDGAPVIYIKDVNRDGTIDSGDGDRVYLYFGLRRGGRTYYALDITDPDDPKMLWSITNQGDFANLGLTFSTPRVGDIRIDSDTERTPVLIFGGGYDINKDTRNGVGTNDTEGNALYVVNAETGDLIWKGTHAELVDSIPSDVTALDSIGDGSIDRLYVGDTGGNLWRADLAGGDPTKWTLNKVLSVGRHAMSGVKNDRRFFHRPDIVLTKDEKGPFDAVIIGSGDRPHPLGKDVENWLYMFKDRNITSGKPPSTTKFHNDLGDVTDNCLQDNPCETDPNLSNGWRLKLEASGEKSLASPTTLGGIVYFTTYLPPGTGDGQTCGPAEGTGRIYKVSLKNATALLPPGYVYDPEYPPTLTKADRHDGLGSGGIPSEPTFISPDKVLLPDLTIEDSNVLGAWRTYWYEAMQQ